MKVLEDYKNWVYYMLEKNNLNMRIAKIANMKNGTKKHLEIMELIADIFDKLNISIDDIIIVMETIISEKYKTLLLEDRLPHIYKLLITLAKTGIIPSAYLISIMEYVKLRLLRDLEKGFEREEK